MLVPPQLAMDDGKDLETENLSKEIVSNEAWDTRIKQLVLRNKRVIREVPSVSDTYSLMSCFGHCLAIRSFCGC